jgi:hypothetical protein
MFQTLGTGSSFLNLDLDLFDFKFVSDFDIRISDLFRWRPFDFAQDMLGAIKGRPE